MPRSRTTLALALALFTAGPAAGQESPSEALFGLERDRIETDRDSITPATTVVGRGRAVVESSYSFIDNPRVAETHSFPEFLARLGVGGRFELRFGVNYEAGGAPAVIFGNGLGDLGDFEKPGVNEEARLLYGFKFRATEQQGPLPGSSVIVQAFTPTAGANTDTHVLAGYVFGWEFESGWQLDASVRYGTGSLEEDRFGAWSPSAVLRVPLGDRWTAHGEYFGLFTVDREAAVVRHFLSGGAHVLVSDDVEVGVRVGFGLNGQSANFFSNVGVGLRF